MKSIFDKVSNDCSRLVIKRYSTSFYFSSNLLSKTIRQDIFNIYGFVRLADEIVDTFHGFPKKELLEDFEIELWRSIKNKISLNPILNSFQYTVNKYSIPHELINSFLDSMKMDLEKKEPQSKEKEVTTKAEDDLKKKEESTINVLKRNEKEGIEETHLIGVFEAEL